MHCLMNPLICKARRQDFPKITPMRTKIRKIGNSRGVLIPTALLAKCRSENEVELHVHNGRLVMEPVKAPRAGWFDHLVRERDLAPPGWSEQLPSKESDWAW